MKTKAKPTKTYRMEIPATIYCDMPATSKKEALAKAEELAYRLRDGIDLPNVDTEDELSNAVAFPERKEIRITDEVTES